MEMTVPSSWPTASRLALAALLLPAALGAQQQSSDPQTTQLIPRVPHAKERAATLNSDGQSARIVIKFHQGSGVHLGSRGLAVRPGPQSVNPYVPQLSPGQVAADIAKIEGLADAYRYEIATLIDDDEQSMAELRATAEGYWGRELADLSLYVQIILGDWGRGRDLPALVARINALPSVEIAYAEPLAFPGAVDNWAPNPPDGPYNCGPLGVAAPNLEAEQGYLAPAPVGVDAYASWNVDGGDGGGIRVIDIEAGYFEHDDLPPLLSFVGHQGSCSPLGWNNACRRHGRHVAGVLVSLDNGVGTTGIAHGAKLGMRSIINTNLHPDGTYTAAIQDSFLVANHIYWGAKHSLQGVVLLELQRTYQGLEATVCPCKSDPVCTVTAPVEFWPLEFDTIQQAVGNGVVVVEAAGNSGLNLDDPVFGGQFEPAGPDSGAILVTGSSSTQRVPLCDTGTPPNTGTRVDLHSWGEDVATTGWGLAGDRLFDGGACGTYVDNFNGSSSASAIVAGVVASLQGAVLHATGAKLDPGTVRSVLVATGTPQDLAASDPDAGPIGPQPNLAAALALVLP